MRREMLLGGSAPGSAGEKPSWCNRAHTEPLSASGHVLPPLLVLCLHRDLPQLNNHTKLTHKKQILFCGFKNKTDEQRVGRAGLALQQWRNVP